MKHFALYACMLVLAACSKGPDAGDALPVHRHADSPGIAWYGGTVQQAFVSAAKLKRPVFLYWGASWCPPCQQLKSTVFSRPGFIEKTKLFIPVYLDGDEEAAQKVGETFRVTGYPTLVAFDPVGHDVMRIAGGMDLSQYGNVLDLALDHIEPAQGLLDAAVGGKRLSAKQCERLALNAWSLEEVPEAELATKASALESAAGACPVEATAMKDRLTIAGMDFRAKKLADPQAQGAKIDSRLVEDLVLARAALDDDARLMATGDALLGVGQGVFVAAHQLPDAGAWLHSFERGMEKISVSDRYATADKLLALSQGLLAQKLVAGRVRDSDAADLIARLKQELAKESIAFIRSGIIDSSLNGLDASGHNDVAYDIVKAELGRSPNPFYWKGDLGDLAEALGRKQEALDWYQQAFNESKGSATRFQWGFNYATALIRIRPEDPAAIVAVTTAVLSELDGSDRIYRRARLRLEGLDKALRKWDLQAKGKNAAALSQLRSHLQGICSKIPAEETARASCDAFLSGYGPGARPS